MHPGAPPLLGAEAGVSRVSLIHSSLANLKPKSRRPLKQPTIPDLPKGNSMVGGSLLSYLVIFYL